MWQQHTLPTASTIYGRSVVQIAAEQWGLLKGDKPQAPPTDPATAPPVALAAGGGVLVARRTRAKAEGAPVVTEV